MKSWLPVFLILAVLVLLAPAMAQNTASAPVVPKYDRTTEAVFKGVVVDVIDHTCPVSGGLGAHILLKSEDGKVIEVHLATTKFIKNYEMVFNKGDVVEVKGSKVKFEDKDTILAREITRNGDLFVFRDKDGKPAW